MTRKKVKLAYITNDSSRKATFKKRKKGLMKKVSELSTLCGIDACAIIYSPYESEPEVWPSPMGAQRVISQFKNMPEMEQNKKMMNQESFLRQRISKANEHLKKQLKDNREKEMSQVMSGCLTGKGFQGLTMLGLSDLGWLIDQRLKDIYHKIKPTNKKVEPVEDYQYQPQAVMSGPMGVATAGAGTSRSVENHYQVQAGDNQRLVHGGFDHHQMMNNMNHHVVAQKQPWFMEELMNMNVPQDLNVVMGSADDVMLPFVDRNHNPMWSNGFFP